MHDQEKRVLEVASKQKTKWSHMKETDNTVHIRVDKTRCAEQETDCELGEDGGITAGGQQTADSRQQAAGSRQQINRDVARPPVLPLQAGI
jgi:hypothetical protein